METLLNTYRDDDDDDDSPPLHPNLTPHPNPNPNLQPHPDPYSLTIDSTENPPPTAASIAPDPKAELITAENQAMPAESEPKPELTGVQLPENQILAAEPELMRVQLAENQTLAAETGPKPELIGEIHTPAAEPEPEPKSELMSVQLAENQTLVAEKEPKSESMSVQLADNERRSAEMELMSVQLAGNPTLAAGFEAALPRGVLEASPVVESEPMVVELAENATPVTKPDSEIGKGELLGSEDITSDSVSENVEHDDEEEELEAEGSVPKKQKAEEGEVLATPKTTVENGNMFVNGNGVGNGVGSKKSSSKKKSKNNNVWTKSTSRKGKKKAKNFSAPPKVEDNVLIVPTPRFPDKNDDSPDAKICLSKVYKAEKVELSEDRMSAGSCKGYRMVRATRGVSQGAWYFEIKVVHLGETGHTRLGWSLEKGDSQAPVGYDSNSFGYRDIDGSKIHKALREKYGEEGYKEGDVIGFYISLPEGDSYIPKSPHFVFYKGKKYACGSESKESPPQTVPGSEISFFKNGVCQGVAFKDLFGGRYYPAASMYTLPDQPNCVVKFNFGPDFECFPADLEGRPVPEPMIEVPYHGYESYDNRVENGVPEENKQ